MFNSAFQNQNVLVTGHTGFKGSWLSKWLVMLGAHVHGYALDPASGAVLYDQLHLPKSLVSDTRKDIRDLASLRSTIQEVQPAYIFHLAAQPLVRESFQTPLETFATNVMGTANLLDAARCLENQCSIVIVTTDKCYENREWVQAYRENDPMGGHDPYSASKGCAELVVNSYRKSFFHLQSSHPVASARAGNVIGGGDWATDRIVPDIFRAVFAGRQVSVRNPHATRPWQHVLEPLSGYLWLAVMMHQSKDTTDGTRFRDAFNFGPGSCGNRTVGDLVETVTERAGGTWQDASDANAPHEASLLNLAIDKAFHTLRWHPVWDFDTTVQKTTEWYVQQNHGESAEDLTLSQINDYCENARNLKLTWAYEKSPSIPSTL